MVTPGSLPLSIIRGIQFDEYVLQCRDESVAITGTLSPNVVGTYALCGTFAAYPLFILEGTPSTFLYFNPVEASYVIARLLTDGALTDYWSPASPLTEPTGTYAPQGANTGTATADDNPTDLTGLTAEALVRRSDNINSETVLDLNPSVTDAATGEITIPAISKDDTEDLRLGNFHWDLVLKDTNTLERFGPYIKGPFTISDNITSSLV